MRTSTPPSQTVRRGLLACSLLMSLALFGCGGADDPGSRTMPVVPLSSMPPIIHEQPRSQEVIDGGLAMLHASVSGFGMLKFQWRRNGEPIAGANEGGLTMPAVTMQDEGVYTLVISNEAGTVVSEGAKLSIRVDPTMRRPDSSCADRAASGTAGRCNRVVLFLR
jgi:Immunoglobulin I-set domain